MIYAANFIVRVSGKRENSFYIDYSGSYTVPDLAKITGLSLSVIEEIYRSQNAAYDEHLRVYYFPSIEEAEQSIKKILAHIEPEKIGKAVYLTDQEIEFIRQALISVGSSTVKFNNKMKDDIFRKLNEA